MNAVGRLEVHGVRRNKLCALKTAKMGTRLKQCCRGDGRKCGLEGTDVRQEVDRWATEGDRC